MQGRFLLMMGGNQMGHCPWRLGQADAFSLGCVLLVCLWAGGQDKCFRQFPGKSSFYAKGLLWHLAMRRLHAGGERKAR